MRRAISWVLFSFGCAFQGDATDGQPCDNDYQCGRDLMCEANVCGGPSSVTKAGADGGGSDGGDGVDDASASPICGDGVLDSGELCDDGNAVDSDACSNDCHLQQGIVAVTAGLAHTCALRSTGQVRCWGAGASGVLGNASTQDLGDDEWPASGDDVALPLPAVSISARDSHTCAALEDGSVMCWGLGLAGRLGYGDEQDVGDDEQVDEKAPLVLLPGADSVSAGSAHTCARLGNGSARCWGAAAVGQLGNGSSVVVGDTEPAAAGAPVALSTSIEIVVAGGQHTCALSEGSLYCFGEAGSGQLGYGDDIDVGLTVLPESAGPVPLGQQVVAVAAGEEHSCAVLADGTLKCWGDGTSGKLGIGTLPAPGAFPTPQELPNVDVGAPVGSVVAAVNHTCALTVDAGLVCWGRGMSGRLGYATTADVGDDEAPATRGLVDVGGDVKQVAVGAAHTCAVRTDGEVLCWGYGINGRLGYGSESDVGDDEIPASVGPVEVFDLADDAPPIGPREPYARCLSDYQCESGACIELESGAYDGFCAAPCTEATDCPWRPGIHRACTEFASGNGCNFDCEDIDCPDGMSCVYVTGTPEGGSQPMCFWDKE